MKKKKKRNRHSGIPDILFIIGVLLILYAAYFKTTDTMLIAGITVCCLAMLSACLPKYIKRNRLLSADVSRIYNMDGIEFENCCIEHFKKLGYKAEPTATSGDFGADILLRKNGRLTVVQCKRYKDKVGVSAVQEVVGALGYYKADSAMVITNSRYTPAARELAKANNVELWDIDDLISIFRIRN